MSHRAHVEEILQLVAVEPTFRKSLMKLFAE